MSERHVLLNHSSPLLTVRVYALLPNSPPGTFVAFP
jgi:hypothetical protein